MFVNFEFPSHQGIYGNERADTAAKNAALHGTNATNEIQILKHEHKKAIFKVLRNKWNEIWSREPTSKLHNIRESSYKKTPDFEIRKDLTAITRLRIGHTNITHAYLMDRSQKKMCTRCDTPISVKHLIIECSTHQHIRKNLGLQPTLEYCKITEIYNVL